jgi:integrase
MTVRHRDDWETKAGASRTIPLNSACQDMLPEYSRIPGCEWGFWYGSWQTPPEFSKIRRALMQSAGVEALRCHCLRNSFASHLVIASIDIRTVQEFMGHRSIQMAMAFAQL